MFLVRILAWIVLIALIFWGAFYSWLLGGLSTTVWTINSGFWAFIPVEIRIFFSLIILTLVIGLVYAFKK